MIIIIMPLRGLPFVVSGPPSEVGAPGSRCAGGGGSTKIIMINHI